MNEMYQNTLETMAAVISLIYTGVAELLTDSGEDKLGETDLLNLIEANVVNDFIERVNGATL